MPRKKTRTLPTCGCGVAPTDWNMPGNGLTGAIDAGGVQPAGAVGKVPICIPAVTPELVAGGLVAAGAPAGGCAVGPLEHAATISENAASVIGKANVGLINGVPFW
jgi:hypothetical protein